MAHNIHRNHITHRHPIRCGVLQFGGGTGFLWDGQACNLGGLVGGEGVLTFLGGTFCALECIFRCVFEKIGDVVVAIFDKHTLRRSRQGRMFFETHPENKRS